MSKHTGQRRAAKRRRVPAIGWVAIVVALGLTMVTAAAVVTGPDGNGEGGASADARDDATTTPAERQSCADATKIGVPQAYLAVWQETLSDFEPSQECEPVIVMPVQSAAVALDKAPEMGIWIPEDATWTERAATSVWTGRPPKAAPLARTPIVAATTADVDAAVGGIQKVFVPSVFGALVRQSRDFADLGDESAGTLRIALPDPGATAAGSLGFAALTQAATGKPLSDVPAYVNPTERDLTTIKTEHRVVTVSKDEAATLDELDPARSDKANVVVTTEQAALAHDAAAPDQPLGVGYLGVDLTMSAVAMDKAAQPMVEKIGAYLTSTDGAKALTAAGLRPAAGSGTPAASGAIQPASFPTVGVTATAEQVSDLSLLFGAMHQRISTLVLLDASGSMLQPLPGTDVSKIDLVRRAARDTLKVASPNARAGLMTFRSDKADRPVISTPVRLAANGSRSQGTLHSTAVLKAVNRLRVDGGTPLYNAVRDAYKAAVKAYDADMVNQVVVLSDGRNQDAVGSIGLSKLLSSLRAEADPDRPVRIIAIGYGPDADMDALNKIVGVTKGRASWLRSVEGYSAAVQEALFAA